MNKICQGILLYLVVVIVGVIISVVVLATSPKETFDAGWKVAEPNEPEIFILFGVEDVVLRYEPNDIIILKGRRRAWQEEDYGRIDFTPRPNEPSELTIDCACGWEYKIMGDNICYSQKYSIVTKISEPNEPEWKPSPDTSTDVMVANKPQTYTAKELEEIYKDEPELGKLAKSLWGYEPNEPVATKVITGQLFWNTKKGLDNSKRWFIYDGNEFILIKDN